MLKEERENWISFIYIIILFYIFTPVYTYLYVFNYRYLQITAQAQIGLQKRLANYNSIASNKEIVIF